LHACQGNVEGALIAAQEARKIILAFGIPIMSSQAYAFLANLNLMVGKKDEAIQWVTVYQTNRDTNKSEYEDMTLARILIATNPSDYIPLLLNPILEKALNAGRFQTCIEIMVLMSAFHCSINETADAINWLTQSIHLAAPRGFIRIFIDDGKPMVHILHKVHASAPEFVDHLLKNSKLGNEVSFSANSQLVEPLSEQELRVLNFILEGKSNQEIATFLYISVGTAKWHVHNILQKLGVNNRPQAIARARQLGLG